MAVRQPVHDVLDLLGRRWAMRVLWELRRDALPFSPLRQRLGISSSVLAVRLGELRAAGVVELDDAHRYRLTGAGGELARILYEVNRWAQRTRAAPAVSEPSAPEG